MRIVRFPQLEAEYGIPYTRVHIDRMERASRFPARLRLGPGCVGWLASEVDAWIAARASERVTKAAA